MPEQLIAMLEGLIEQLKAHSPYEDSPARGAARSSRKPMDVCLMIITGKPMHGKGGGVMPPPFEPSPPAKPSRRKRRVPARITQGKARAQRQSMPPDDPEDDDEDDEDDEEEDA